MKVLAKGSSNPLEIMMLSPNHLAMIVQRIVKRIRILDFENGNLHFRIYLGHGLILEMD
jgi:hypothetical protein